MRFWRGRHEHWDAFGSALQGIAALLALGGAAYAATITYQQWRSDRVLKFQEQWAAPDMVARRNRLVDALVCNVAPQDPDRITSQNPLKFEASGIDGNISDFAYWKNANVHSIEIVSPSKDYVGLESDLPAYLDFFSSVSLCMKSGVCEPHETCTHFADKAQALQSMFGPFLERQRVLFWDSDYGDEFEEIGRQCARIPPAPRRPHDEKKMVSLREELAQEWMSKGRVRSQQIAACERMKPSASDAKTAK